MFNKRFFRDSLLPLSVLLALLRLQWDPVSQRHRVEIQGIQDIFLGESVALTETQFHQWYSTYEDEYVHVHPKRVDSGVYSRSIFSELHTLNSRNRLLNLIPDELEITTLLLDNDESYPSRNLIPSNSDVISQNNVNVEHTESIGDVASIGNGDLNNNFEAVAGASSGDLLMDIQGLSPEDADLIEALWHQDIDMGITREDRFPNKMEVELEKPAPIESKVPQWDIDDETGEYLPRETQVEPTPAVVSNEPSAVPDENAVFEDFLTDLLDGYNTDGVDPPSSSRVVPQLTDALEIEQRWQDLASISEFQMSPLGNNSRIENPVTSNTQSNYPNTTWNSSLPSGNQNVFAFNATTNGNVNLQNATGPQLSLFNNTDQPLTSSGLLAAVDQETQFLSSVNETQMNLTSPDLFSPINRFNDMSISGGLPASPASSQGSSVNLTMLMMEQQALDLPVRSPQPTSVSPTQRPNGSLLLELLNATEANSSNASEEMDTEMYELDNMINMLTANDSAPMDLLSDEDSFSSGEADASEGATGFNQDPFKRDFKRYNRGGDSPCHSDTGSTSSFDSSQSADNHDVHHNHSYAASSDTGNQKAVRSSNNSRNGTSESGGQGRVSRDEKRAKELNIPIPVDKIINLPVDSFNDLVKKYDLSSEQMQLIRDIRRRGKNKVAAQNCRKRKITAIHQVEGSVGAMQNEHDKLLKERDKISEEVEMMQSRFDELYNQVFRNMRGSNGEPVDPDQFRLEIMGDGSVILVPRNDTSSGLRGQISDKESSPN